MRRLAPLCSALVGVALTWPLAACAGVPETDLMSNGQPGRAAELAPCKHKHYKRSCAKCREAARVEAQAHRGPQLCARCLAQRYPGMTVRAPGASGGTFPGAGSCTACEAAATGGAPPVFATMAPGEAPGQAIVGLPPGATFAGGTVLSAEPAPVGVMRTSYLPTGPTAEPPGYATVGSPAAVGGMTAGQAIPPAPDIIAPARHRRPHVLTHLLGLDALGAHRRERIARHESAHAAIAYGSTDQHVTELPASMVYGR